MEERKLGTGAKVWFGFVVLCQWLMFVEYATKPITKYNSAYQQATMIYFFFGLVGTVLYLWLAKGKSKTAMTVIFVMALLNVIVLLFNGGGLTAFASLIVPAISYAIIHEKLG